jgi:hypothetical protein
VRKGTITVGKYVDYFNAFAIDMPTSRPAAVDT